MRDALTFCFHSSGSDHFSLAKCSLLAGFWRAIFSMALRAPLQGEHIHRGLAFVAVFVMVRAGRGGPQSKTHRTKTSPSAANTNPGGGADGTISCPGLCSGLEAHSMESVTDPAADMLKLHAEDCPQDDMSHRSIWCQRCQTSAEMLSYKM